MMGSWLRALLLICLAPAACAAQSADPGGISLPTDLRLQSPGWWPTKGDRGREEYIGTAECAKCHAAKAASYQATAMAHAAAPAADSGALRHHPLLAMRIGPYSYQLQTAEGKSLLKVSDDTASLCEVLTWALGEGRMGQTYLYEHDGKSYESHLSFFTAPQALDITPGQPRSTPHTIAEAPGRPLSPDEVHRCLGCHTTASTTKGQFDPNKSFAGVTCESCHGPGASHATSARSGNQDSNPGFIFNPASMNRVDAVDFCGACHRTWEDVVIGGLTGVGVFNVRFAPYRLENSKCWKKGDDRITCTSCHDPHQPLVREEASYDSRCLACHLISRLKSRLNSNPDFNDENETRVAARLALACPVSDSKCVTCHMPKVEPPGLHSVFTDHWIRIVKPGAPYPN